MLNYRIMGLALGMACIATPAFAHPHVWIEMRSDVVIDDQGLITAFNIQWTFDDGYTQMALDGPIDPRAGEFVVKVYDPDFFIAIDYVKDDPVSILGKAPDPCRLALKPVPTGAELEQTRLMLASKGKEWQPENNEDFGAMFAQAVSIQCS